MLTTDDAFRKFKSRLELNDREQENASKRQNEVRDYLDTKFAIFHRRCRRCCQEGLGKLRSASWVP